MLSRLGCPRLARHSKMTKLDKLIQDAATKEVDGEGFRKRMEKWLNLHEVNYIFTPEQYADFIACHRSITEY